jgi:hypothetical protein
MLNYLFSVGNIWAAFNAWNFESFYGKPLALLCLVISLLLFLQQRDIDEQNKLEKGDE